MCERRGAPHRPERSNRRNGTSAHSLFLPAKYVQGTPPFPPKALTASCARVALRRRRLCFGAGREADHCQRRLCHGQRRDWAAGEGRTHLQSKGRGERGGEGEMMML